MYLISNWTRHVKKCKNLNDNSTSQSIQLTISGLFSESNKVNPTTSEVDNHADSKSTSLNQSDFVQAPPPARLMEEGLLW